MISSIFSEHSATQMENGLNLELDFAFFIAYASLSKNLSNIPHFLRVVSEYRFILIFLVDKNDGVIMTI